MSQHTPFLTIFPDCASMADFAGGLDRAYVTEVKVIMAEQTMSIAAWFAAMPSPAEVSKLSDTLRDIYGLRAVAIIPDYPRVNPVVASESGTSAPTGNSGGDVLFGRSIKKKPSPMSELTLESGRVTVEGDVIAVSSRTIQKSGAAVLSFDITDRTNSVRVSRYFRPDDDKSVISKISQGDHLLVQGI